MNPEDLLRIARGLAGGAIGGNVGRPRQAELRRAISAAYYALFHALAQCCADTLAGATRSSRNERAWARVYRALEHGHARNQIQRSRLMDEFPPEIREFGTAFVDMQRNRNAADYAAEISLSRNEAINAIDWCERVIADFASAPIADRRAFAVYVLFRTRGG